MAARLKSRASLFFRILIDNNSNNPPCCARRLYNTRCCSVAVNSRSSNWRRLCSSLVSKAAATNIPANNNIQCINIAVCVERVPLISGSKSDLELQYEELQECLEFEHSSFSDYELTNSTMDNKREQLSKDEDNEELKKEVATFDSGYQELKDIEERHIKDVSLASRTTEADLKDDRGSPYRKLEVPLFLLTPNKENSGIWQMPQGNVEPGETLRQAAERIAKQSVQSNITLQFMSNAPSGVYRKADKDGGKPGSPKVFFYRALLQGAVQKCNKDTWSNCIWASKDELLEYLPSNYYQSVSKFLL